MRSLEQWKQMIERLDSLKGLIDLSKELPREAQFQLELVSLGGSATGSGGAIVMWQGKRCITRFVYDTQSGQIMAFD